MKFKECDIVKIMKDCDEEIKKGEIGVIVMVKQILVSLWVEQVLMLQKKQLI